MPTVLDLDTLFDYVKELEPLPSNVARLARLITAGDRPVSEMVEVIALDPGLTIKLLKGANSAGRGSRLPVSIRPSCGWGLGPYCPSSQERRSGRSSVRPCLNTTFNKANSGATP